MTTAGLLHVEQVMGTVVTFDVRDPDLPAAVLEPALAAAVEQLHRADAVFSTWNPGSALMRARAGHRPSESTADVLTQVERACERARDATRGWFDPWALPGGYDPTGLVKGWAAGRALRSLQLHGVHHTLVNAGGDLIATGNATGTDVAHGAAEGGWQVGITDPHRRDRLLHQLRVHDSSVATSGGYERGSLALDPDTGQPVVRLASATVTGPDLGLADAAATGATAHGPDALGWLAALGPSHQALLVTLDGTVLTTPGWVGEDLLEP